jgi:predicted permease
MSTLRRFLIRLAASATRRRDEQRLREELEQHVAMQTAENVRAGLPPVEARREALLKAGAVEAIKEQYRDEQSLPFLDNLLQDVRYALRQLQRAPVFTLTATLSLAMGIGATAAVFTVVERVLFRPLSVSRPQELVFIADQRIAQEQNPRFSYPFYASLRDNSVLEGVAARFSMGVNTDVGGRIARVSAELVSGNYFSVVGAGTQIGRTLTPEDDRTPGAHAVAVISDAWWRRDFGSDPSVLGRDVQVNNHTFSIIGVAAKGFGGTDVGSSTDVWLPMTMQREVGRDFLTDARTNWLEIIGRLSSGMSLERAGEELTTYFRRRAPDLQAHFPERRLMLLPGDKGNSTVRRELGQALRVLLALTALALVLACVNVASLLVLRSAAREKEIAVRLAIGARRSRLTRQLLTETLLLAAIGGTAGLLMAPSAARLLVASLPHRLSIDASLDMRVLLFGLVVSVLTGLFVGQAPIFASRKVGLTQAFGSCTWTTPSRRLTAHDLVVTFQIATSLAMLISAALLVQSVRSLSSVDPGFRADDQILVTLDPKAAGYDGNRVAGFWRDTLDRVGQIRGVQSVSLARVVPLAPGRMRQTLTHPTSGERTREIDLNFVGPRYFRTLDIPLLRGREFDEKDGRTSRPVVIVNERMARMFWLEQDPIGKALRVPGLPKGSPDAEVVGLVKDVKYRDLRGDTGPMFYRPILQTTSTDAMTLHVRAAGDPGALIGAIRSEMQSLDPNVPLFTITTLEELLNASFAQTRQAAMLTGVFGILALLLSGIGVYGVTALAVTRRTRDIGVRMALGAQRRDIVGLIGQRGLTLVVAGLGLGLLASFGFTRFAGTLLYGVTPGDTATFAGMSALLAVVSLIAFAIPVRTAVCLDAAAAIRYE